ncbi:MAG TPA: AAA family ATPase [Jatrophihabitantaceae bacterium]
MRPRSDVQVLLNRHKERRLLDQLVDDVRAGQSRALVIRGEAGIGKTALLDYLVDQATDCQPARAAGVEAERELAFAALHQLCAPMLDQLTRLPDPQQEALRTAFGLRAGNHPPDRFMVGLAVLGLFAEVARKRPLLCVIDDAQWLDHASAQVLAFAARRLLAESVAVIFAVREEPEQVEAPALTRLAELVLTGLPDDEARELLTSAHPGPVDDRVLARIVAESQGNPLALLELPRGFTPMELAGGFGLNSAELPRRIEESFRRQIATLSSATRRVLLVAAAEPVGDPVLVLRAVDRLGIDVDAATSPGAAQLVEIASRVRFRHPLLRSVIYHAATPEERRSVHRALAQVTDPVADPDRRAWHLAQAAAGPDEDVAGLLERSAGRAQGRGGPAAAAAFFARASELTPDPMQRGQRALAAAQAKHQAGLPESSSRLLTLADASPLGEFQRAQADLLRAHIAFTTNRGRETPALLLTAATRLLPLDVRLARDTYLDALRAAWFTAHLSGGANLRDVAEAARAATGPLPPTRASDLLLAGLAVRYTDGYAAGAPLLRRALRAFRGRDLSDGEGMRWLWFAAVTAQDLFDDDSLALFADRFARLARDTGTLAALPMALTIRSVVEIQFGDLTAAAASIGEFCAVVEGTEVPEQPYAAQLLAAWQGRERRAGELIAATSAESERRGEGSGLIAAGWMRALVSNGRGRYDEALVAARQAVDVDLDMGVLTWAPLTELIVAAARSGRPDLGADAFRRLAELTQASGTNWALGLEAFGRALLADGPAVESSYREAIDRLARTRVRGLLARTHLHYGEWLRRQRRRVDAREQLRTAHELFTATDMDGFAGLAARELGATGETVRKRHAETSSRLTAQEAQVARLVGDGLSNAEVAARMFISRRTVEWHLSQVFAKLQVTSRQQLRR